MNFAAINEPRMSYESEAPGVPEGPVMDVEETLLRGAGTHIKYQFAVGATWLHCKIFFTEQFDALRRHCGCDSTFVESLTRCRQWEAMGGKSGSTFLKTRDDRLVLKQLSRLEMDAFLSFLRYISSTCLKHCFTKFAYILILATDSAG